jgi:hypothetical protein
MPAVANGSVEAGAANKTEQATMAGSPRRLRRRMKSLQ